MMKFVAVVLSVFLSLNSSQASTIQVRPAAASLRPLALKNRTVTKSVLALAIPKHQRKLFDLTDDEDDDLPGPDELDLQSPYARPRLTEKRTDLDLNDDISDYVTVRLAVARARALAKYREVWS